MSKNNDISRTVKLGSDEADKYAAFYASRGFKVKKKTATQSGYVFDMTAVSEKKRHNV